MCSCYNAHPALLGVAGPSFPHYITQIDGRVKGMKGWIYLLRCLDWGRKEWGLTPDSQHALNA